MCIQPLLTLHTRYRRVALHFRGHHKDLAGLLKHRSLPLDPPSVSDSVCLGQGRKTLHPWQAPRYWSKASTLKITDRKCYHPSRAIFPPLSSGNHGLFSVIMISLPFFWMACKWRHTECTLLCLAVFHTCEDLRELPVLLHVVYSYLLLSGVLSSEYSTVGLLILFRHICFSPSIGLSWIKFPWTFMYKCLCGHTFSSFLGKYLGVEMVGHRVDICSIF